MIQAAGKEPEFERFILADGRADGASSALAVGSAGVGMGVGARDRLIEPVDGVSIEPGIAADELQRIVIAQLQIAVAGNQIAAAEIMLVTQGDRLT